MAKININYKQTVKKSICTAKSGLKVVWKNCNMILGAICLHLMLLVLAEKSGNLFCLESGVNSCCLVHRGIINIISVSSVGLLYCTDVNMCTVVVWCVEVSSMSRVSPSPRLVLCTALMSTCAQLLSGA